MTLEQAKKGLTPALALEEQGHEEHEINTEREVEAIHGFRESQLEKTEARRLRRRSAHVGHGDRSRQVHRMLGLRHRVLR